MMCAGETTQLACPCPCCPPHLSNSPQADVLQTLPWCFPQQALSRMQKCFTARNHWSAKAGKSDLMKKVLSNWTYLCFHKEALANLQLNGLRAPRSVILHRVPCQNSLHILKDLHEEAPHKEASATPSVACWLGGTSGGLLFILTCEVAQVSTRSAYATVADKDTSLKIFRSSKDKDWKCKQKH